MAMALAQYGCGFPSLEIPLSYTYAVKTFQILMSQLMKHQILKQEALLSK